MIQSGIEFCQTVITIIPASLETGQYLTITRNLDISFPLFGPFLLQNPVPVQTIVSTKGNNSSMLLKI